MNYYSQDSKTGIVSDGLCAAATQAFAITKINGADTLLADDIVAVEQPLTVYLNNVEFITLVHSPGQEMELVIGLLASEGIIHDKLDVRKISINSAKGTACVETASNISGRKTGFLKRYFSSCCGKSRPSFYFVNDALMARKRTFPSDLKVSAGHISYCMELLDSQSTLFRQTGGVHGGALIMEGRLGGLAFDIGRHNVLDKLYGQALENGEDLSRQIIVFSGRIASEILIKTSKMGCPIIAGMSAPTNLALELAQKLGITVIGFVRQNRMNVYTHPERIVVE
jgi:FdhD protein